MSEQIEKIEANIKWLKQELSFFPKDSWEHKEFQRILKEKQEILKGLKENGR